MIRGVCATVAVAVAVLTGCSTSTPIGDTSPGDPLSRTYTEGKRPAVPDLAGTSLEGKTVRLSDYRGKVVVLNAWASWCPPCRVESPQLKDLQKKWGARGVQVLGLNNDGSRTDGLAFERQHALGYPSLHDPSGKQLLRLPHGLVNTRALPFTIVVDATGKAAATRMGQVTEAELTKLVRPLL
ncbi:TlpA family protein disulfide reductase [Streptomyces sp. NPDC057257]|uniref:TlpA family protein disulfide reductase n=1 Tax=Streptomyces sp. NPDC057257 TaxID=3346071 RepID=UPI00363E0048